MYIRIYSYISNLDFPILEKPKKLPKSSKLPTAATPSSGMYYSVHMYAI